MTTTTELRATTDAGAEMVEAATRFAAEFADAARVHDRDGSFAVDHLDKLRSDGFLVAPIPAQLGGGGVESTHDLLVASSRLARGDAATTIGVNMHLAAVVNLVTAWRRAVARWDEPASITASTRLRRIVADDVVFAAAISEPSPQDLTCPATIARRSEHGWTVAGRKSFVTMAPHATILNVAVTYIDPMGRNRYGFASVPTVADGVEFHDDWDVLGMRGSASGSVSFHHVEIPREALADGFLAGEWSAAMLDRYLVSGALHSAASLGIAEHAHQVVVDALRRREDPGLLDDAHTTTTLGANVVDLAAMRASLSWTGRVLDEHDAQHPMGAVDTAEVQAVFAQVQAAKSFIADAAVRVVDRALALSGGAGYRSEHPLSKAWRDVRATAFMHPLGANRVDAFLARTALGRPPG